MANPGCAHIGFEIKIEDAPGAIVRRPLNRQGSAGQTTVLGFWNIERDRARDQALFRIGHVHYVVTEGQHLAGGWIGLGRRAWSRVAFRNLPCLWQRNGGLKGACLGIEHGQAPIMPIDVQPTTGAIQP